MAVTQAQVSGALSQVYDKNQEIEGLPVSVVVTDVLQVSIIVLLYEIESHYQDYLNKYSFSHTFISYSSFKNKGNIIIITYQIIIKLNENIHHIIAIDIQPNSRNVAI